MECPYCQTACELVGLCHCGCGGKTNGKYARGHALRGPIATDCVHCSPGACPVGKGFCHCGCGRETKPYVSVGHSSFHGMRGAYWKFQQGHHLTQKRPPTGCIYCPPGQCPVGVGMCHCGCGTKTKPKNRAFYKFVKNHWRIERRRHVNQICPHCPAGTCPVEYGTCHCGCGQQVSLRRDRLPGKFVRSHKPGLLSDDEVRTIRYRYLHEDITQAELGRIYNRAPCVITKVLCLDSYRHVK